MSRPAAGARALDPRWMVGCAPRGIVCAHGEHEVVLGLEARFPELLAILEALRAGPHPPALAAAAGTSEAEAARALDVLVDQGVLVPPAPAPAAPAEGIPLAAAILRAAEGEPITVAWTAEELLVLPPGVEPPVARRAVRSFVAGLAPDARLEAYAAVAAQRRPSVAGDLPEPQAVEAALQRVRAANPAAVHAVRLDGSAHWTLPVGRLGEIGMEEPHRLGPLQRVCELDVRPPLLGRRASWSAEYAVGNLASPWPRAFRLGRGTNPTRDGAELVARAEAAERFGAYEVDPGRLRRARAADLEDPLDPTSLWRFSSRQLEEHPELAPRDPDVAILWIEGRDRHDRRRWLPAEAVHVGLTDPRAPALSLSSSSGLAAAPTAPDAAQRALLELVERDAFMWTWVQEVSRERVDPSGLPEDSRDLAAAIERMGYGVALVNLTLETKPVIMSVLHRADRIHVAAACREMAAQAAAKALDETALVVSLEHGHDPPEVRVEEVETPEDHLWLHFRPEMVQRAAFLFSSDDVVDLREVESLPGPAAEAVAPVAEPAFADLTSPRTAPFAVVRALAPGLVPLSFGWDREAAGLARLAAPRRTVDGRVLGAELDLDRAAPILPHPFP